MINEPWALSPSVALRPEPFGALAYHFGNRRLTFLKTNALVDVVRGLATAPDVRAALENAGVGLSERAAYVNALRGLADAGMIRPREMESSS